MNHQMEFIVFILFMAFVASIKVQKVKMRSYDSSIAIKRLKERIQYLGKDTSCKVAAKFILLTICNIRTKSEIPILPLTDDFRKNLELIKDKVMKGDVLQIEIKSNHHFIIFKKNDRDLYLLQAFQDRFKLIEWISNEKIMEPYLTIDTFFKKMEILLFPSISRNLLEKTIIDLFLPPIFTTDQELIDKTLSYFIGNTVKLIKVNYVDFDFSLKEKGEAFNSFFYYVDHHYRIY